MLWYNTTILRSKDFRIKFPSARTNLQEPVRYYTHSALLLFSTFTRAERTADYYRRKYFHDLIRFGKFKTSVARELRKITHRHKRVACFRTKFVMKLRYRELFCFSLLNNCFISAMSAFCVIQVVTKQRFSPLFV